MSKPITPLHIKLSNYKIINDCWIWQGYKLSDGYGGVCINNKNIRAHRAVYEFHKGSINGKILCHKCDNPLCVNPEHLFVGTQADNVKDMVKKKRHNNYNGWAGKPKAKLTIDNVKFIRQSNHSNSELAKMFNVKPVTIKEVKNYESWRKV